MRTRRLLALVLVLVAVATLAQGVPATPATPARLAAVSFDDLWATAVSADKSGDSVGFARALAEIRRLRVERNVVSLDAVGLGMVLLGMERLEKGERASAEEVFRQAVAIAPGLPEAHFALGRAVLQKGPLGVPAAVKAALGGMAACRETSQGEARLATMATVGWLLLAFAVCWVVGVALLLRNGGLLRHDLEEWLGSTRRSWAPPLTLALLLLPPAAFLGWGWLPLWWFTLLFAYLARAERVVVGVLALAVVSVGPVASSLDRRLQAEGNALYAAALASVEGVPERSQLERLARAGQADPQDWDLAYLLGVGLKRAGHYDESAEHYRRLLAEDPGDAFARNNLAGIEFARGAYDQALARYKQGEGSPNAEVAATSYYNQSIAHLQKFEYEASNEAKSAADRLARGLVERYEGWKYDSGDYAVVDLGMTPEQVRQKFQGMPEGVASRNVARGGVAARRGPSSLPGLLLGRFLVSLVVAGLIVFGIGRWRGPKAFTLHCARCGTAFCRHCHLGRVAGDLCTQCYHLFVVRDGVSGPARNRKLVEVQEAEKRRGRIFRVLSLLSPGAGHVYSGRAIVGAALTAVWYALLTLLAVPVLFPFAGVSGRIAPWWPFWVVGLLLLFVWLLANRLSPELEVALPARRSAGGPWRGKVT